MYEIVSFIPTLSSLRIAASCCRAFRKYAIQHYKLWPHLGTDREWNFRLREGEDEKDDVKDAKSDLMARLQVSMVGMVGLPVRTSEGLVLGGAVFNDQTGMMY